MPVNGVAIKVKPGARPGFGWRVGERESHTPAQHALTTGVCYQVKRGPTNHSRSPALASFTSPLRPQFWLNLAVAPTRP